LNLLKKIIPVVSNKKNMNIDSDTKEKLETRLAMSVMFIKILMASFPMLFVPQLCGDSTCSLSEKMVDWNWLGFVNWMTFISFMRLYWYQGKREQFMIEYLDEDDEVSENSLTEQIEEYPEIKERLINLNTKLEFSNNCSAALFLLNTAWSASWIMFVRYLDSTTLTVLLTNSLLVHSKLMQIRMSYTGDDLASSTVAVRPRVFNVIDKDHTTDAIILEVD